MKESLLAVGAYISPRRFVCKLYIDIPLQPKLLCDVSSVTLLAGADGEHVYSESNTHSVPGRSSQYGVIHGKPTGQDSWYPHRLRVRSLTRSFPRQQPRVVVQSGVVVDKRVGTGDSLAIAKPR